MSLIRNDMRGDYDEPRVTRRGCAAVAGFGGTQYSEATSVAIRVISGYAHIGTKQRAETNVV